MPYGDTFFITIIYVAGLHLVSAYEIGEEHVEVILCLLISRKDVGSFMILDICLFEVRVTRGETIYPLLAYDMESRGLEASASGGGLGASGLGHVDSLGDIYVYPGANHRYLALVDDMLRYGGQEVLRNRKTNLHHGAAMPNNCILVTGR